MISSVTLKNYKAHRDTTIELGRFTVLVGPNGSGKTSVLEAIDQLADLASTGNAAPPFLSKPEDPPRSYSRGGTGAFEIGIAGRSAAGATSATLFWSPPANGGSDRHASWELRWSRGSEKGQGISNFQSTVLASLGDAVLYRFEARRVAGVSVSSEERPFLHTDGGNTADVLAALKLADEVVFDRIQTTVRAVIPELTRIRIGRERLIKETDDPRFPKATIGQKIILDFDSAPDISAEDVSEGTLVTLALITAICSGPRPHTVLLDDLGLSLHPTAQMALVKQLHRLLDEMKDMQIVATTHSPYILDEMRPEDVVVLARRADGSVASRRLSEHPNATLNGYVTTGELWGLGDEATWVV